MQYNGINLRSLALYSRIDDAVNIDSAHASVVSSTRSSGQRRILSTSTSCQEEQPYQSIWPYLEIWTPDKNRSGGLVLAL